MRAYDLNQLSRDIVELDRIIGRLKRYIKLDEIVSLIVDKETNISINKASVQGFVQPEGDLLVEKISLSDKIRKAIKENGEATTDVIYEYFKNNHWQINSKIKHSIRGVLASLKSRGEIEGSAKDGFKFIHSNEEKEVYNGLFRN